MKYIKTFEKIKNSELKRYFVMEKDIETRSAKIENNIILYVIYEILNSRVFYENGELIYRYDTQRKYYCKENIIKEQQSRYINDDLKNKKIIYTSDNLDECVEFVKLKFEINKYNL